MALQGASERDCVGGHSGRVCVYIVADFEPLRAGLAKSVATAPDMEVVGTAASLEEMAEEGGHERADVLIVDMQALNKTDRDSMYQRLLEWVPSIRVLFLGTAQEADTISFESVPQAMNLNTIGFLLKNGPIGRILEAVRLIASGAFVCESTVIRWMLTRLTQWASYNPNVHEGQLSEREAEVLTLVARGRSNKEIARELFLSEGTIKTHVSHIMTKLNVDRRTELVRYALGRGLIPLNEE